jgi:hypothetical protein
MEQTYELPTELWDIVMTHFHSCYKKPLHYEAIMKCEYFTRRRSINLQWGLSPLCNRTKYGVFDSFYIWIVLNNWVYWEFSDIDIRKPTLNMNRKVAKGRVKDEFEEIWTSYAIHSKEDNLLSRIHY